MSVEYRLLGPLEVVVDGNVAALGGPRQRAVLVCLVSQPNTVVPATKLVDEVWGDEPPATAANVIQSYVSNLRRVLGKEAIETRGSGYVARVERDGLDLLHFERLAHAGSVALAESRADEAAEALREALGYWRGPALVDLLDEPAVEAVAARLNELHLLAFERRLEADLARGLQGEIVSETQELVRAHPLRERPRWLHMLALYRSGRQAEALESYRQARELLVTELGIEPGPALQELERAILQQDAALSPGTVHAETVPRSLLVTTLAPQLSEPLVEIGKALASRPARELVLIQTVREAGELAGAGAALEEARQRLLETEAQVRTAAFTSLVPGADIARFATEQDADLVLADAPDQLLEDGRVQALLTQVPCDVGIVVGREWVPGDVFVTFTGGEHDWAAVEIGAWLARNLEARLLLAGAASGAAGRDASRLLASASLAVQRVVGVTAEPVLVDPEPDALVSAAAEAAVVCVGLPDRWQREGLGRTRTALATRSGGTTALVRRGLRPSGLAPRGAETRYTWTIAPG